MLTLACGINLAWSQSAWTPPVDLGTAGSLPTVATDAAGNAVAVWKETGGIRASSFSLATGTWSAPVALSAAGDQVTSPLVAMNASGRAIAVWTKLTGTLPDPIILQAAFYSSHTTQWTAPQPEPPPPGRHWA